MAAFCRSESISWANLNSCQCWGDAVERREEGDMSEITAQMLLSPRVSCAAVMLHTHSCTSSDATAFMRHYSRYAFKHETRSILRTCTPDSALVQTSCTARLLSTVLQRRAAQPRNQATSPTRVLFTCLILPRIHPTRQERHEANAPASRMCSIGRDSQGGRAAQEQWPLTP